MRWASSRTTRPQRVLKSGERERSTRPGACSNSESSLSGGRGGSPSTPSSRVSESAAAAAEDVGEAAASRAALTSAAVAEAAGDAPSRALLPLRKRSEPSPTSPISSRSLSSERPSSEMTAFVASLGRSALLQRGRDQADLRSSFSSLILGVIVTSASILTPDSILTSISILAVASISMSESMSSVLMLPLTSASILTLASVLKPVSVLMVTATPSSFASRLFSAGCGRGEGVAPPSALAEDGAEATRFRLPWPAAGCLCGLPSPRCAKPSCLAMALGRRNTPWFAAHWK
mmetsp:Transcript_5966/g.15210  ORF Transcript_5966/g.15210 Transcript_5966/m.15210 type:complete len:290 (-) Transcript_5966:915-1784(-)